MIHDITNLRANKIAKNLTEENFNPAFYLLTTKILN